MHAHSLLQRRFYTMAEVCILTRYSRTHIYRLEAMGLFPRRVKLGLNRIAFRASEIEAWLLSRPYAVPVTFDDGEGNCGDPALCD